MTEKIIIAGAGGQGIMLLGKILAEAAMREGKFVTWIPSYGAEVRGGSAYCMVVISDSEIGSPYIDKADTLIAMNGPSLERFKGRIANTGLLIVNSSLAKYEGPVKQALGYPLTDIAAGLGNIKVANTIVLGCYIVNKRIVLKETVVKVIEDSAPEDKKNLIEINKQALYHGMELVR